MKCYDFKKEVSGIRDRATQELREALRALDRVCRFRDESVSVGICVDKGFASLDVMRVTVVNGDIEVSGLLGGVFDWTVSISDVIPECIPWITAAIPETEKVKDVTDHDISFEILSVDMNDLRIAGFDVSGVDDEVMKSLALRMRDYYISDHFYNDLTSIACDMGIPFRHDTWFEGLDDHVMEDVFLQDGNDLLPKESDEGPKHRDIYLSWWNEKTDWEKGMIFDNCKH